MRGEKREQDTSEMCARDAIGWNDGTEFLVAYAVASPSTHLLI
jgi:hypothetical protein